MFNRIMFIVATLLLTGCAGPVAVGFGPSQANPNSFGLLTFQPPRPQVNPYICDKGVLVKKNSTGEPVCLYREKTVSHDGTVMETLSETTPRMRDVAVGYVNGNSDSLSQYCQPNGCNAVPGPDGRLRWVRN